MADRADCFGAFDKTDANCIDPGKGDCGSLVDCKRASEVSGGVWWKNMPAQKKQEVEEHLAAPPVRARQVETRTPAPKQEEKPSNSALDSLESELDSELGLESSPPEKKAEVPAEIDAAPVVDESGKKRRKRRTKAQIEQDKLAATQAAEGKIPEETKAQEKEQKVKEANVLRDQHEKTVAKAAPVAKDPTEIMNAGLYKQFELLFRPVFQQLIPDAIADRVGIMKDEDGSIVILVKSNNCKVLREVAKVTTAGDDILLSVLGQKELIIEEGNISQGTEMIIASINELNALPMPIYVDKFPSSTTDTVVEKPKGKTRGPKPGSKKKKVEKKAVKKGKPGPKPGSKKKKKV